MLSWLGSAVTVKFINRDPNNYTKNTFIISYPENALHEDVDRRTIETRQRIHI